MCLHISNPLKHYCQIFDLVERGGDLGLQKTVDNDFVVPCCALSCTSTKSYLYCYCCCCCCCYYYYYYYYYY